MTTTRYSRRREGLDSDQGVILLMTAILVPLLLVCCAVAVDISRWYVEIAKVQKTADAAALAGVTWMPQDFTNATTTAVATALKNGYTIPNSAVSKTGKASELQVTVTTTFANFFGGLIGRGNQTITRSAVADFQAPEIMGSPCNGLGRQPLSTSGGTTGGVTSKPGQPAASVIPTVASGGYLTCQDDPGFWLRAAGADEKKNNGDRYATKTCSVSDPTYPAQCSGGNKEYRKEGYFYAIRVQPAAVGKPISVQIYDPAFVYTDIRCDAYSSLNSVRNDFENDGVAGSTAAVRYARSANTYCPGDNFPTGNSAFTTSYILREQTDTFNPLNGAPIAECTKQFRNLDSAPTANQLNKSNAAYNYSLSKVFHQWVHLCTFKPNRTGDYYLQVRSNVSFGGTAETNKAPGSSTTRTAIISKDNPNAWASEPNSESGSGHNMFALRTHTCSSDPGVFPASGVAKPPTAALPTDCSAPAVANPDSAQVSVAGFERFPIYANFATGGTQIFNLIQVAPNLAGATLDFSSYDFGDFGGTGTVTILPPVGSPLSLTTCTYKGKIGGTAGTTGTCTFSVDSSFNGRLQTVSVTVPTTYDDSATNSCAWPSVGGCWFRVRFTTPSDTNEDTTWDAGLVGDPVRLVK